MHALFFSSPVSTVLFFVCFFLVFFGGGGNLTQAKPGVANWEHQEDSWGAGRLEGPACRPIVSVCYGRECFWQEPGASPARPCCDRHAEGVPR